MFLLKKIVSAFLYPLPVCLFVLLAGVVLLWVGRRWRLGRVLVTVGVGLLLLFSLGPLPGAAVYTLEQAYPVFAPERHPGVEVRWVVVLGGGVKDDPALPPNDQLSTTSLARLVEGLRVLQHYPEARLLLSGGSYFGDVPEAEAMKRVTSFLGIDPARVRTETQSADTGDQAVQIRQMIGEEPLVLVTSAVHMPRAMALFERRGMEPIAAPAPHLARTDTPVTLSTLFPSSGNLFKLRSAWHEYLGLLWASLTGQA